MKHPVLICLIACFLWSGFLLAQTSVMTIDSTLSAQEMANTFAANPCSQISNPSLSGALRASGAFFDALPSIGFEAGIILATGNATNAIGPNNTPAAGNMMDTLNYTDADLQQLLPGNAMLRDLAVFEFDFVPEHSEVQFRYVFASEEYCEFALSNFGDVLGIFLSGPGISGPFANNAANLALLPSGDPIAINAVNHQVNSDYYISNIPPNQPNCPGNPLGDPEATENCQYDAFTVVLTAAAQVIPFEQYHLRIAIADVGDGIFDSAIFLEAGSFQAGQIPLAEFEALGSSYEVSFLNQSSGATDYVWDFGDGNTSTDENPTHTYTSTGNYTVTLTASNACGSSTFTQEIQIVLTSLSERPFANHFNLYPNPSDGLFHLELQGQPIIGTPVQFRLYDVLGRQRWLHEADFSTGHLRETIQLEHLASGMYFLEVRAGNQAFQRRLLIR